jgi:drug/metabolite transporter (DMT)-like permease
MGWLGRLAFFAARRYFHPLRATLFTSPERFLGLLIAVVVPGERLASWQCLVVVMVVAGRVLFEKASVTE